MKAGAYNCGVTEDQFDESLLALRAEVEERWRTSQGTPPPIVYHYTSGAALKGIVGSGRLWATVTSELNDMSELLRATEVLKSTLNRHAKAAALPEYQVLFPPQVTEFDYPRSDLATTFVASLSGTEDDLPQWSMYADSFRGVALGFDSKSLLALDAGEDISQPLGFFAMSYSQTDQEAFFDWLVTRWEREASAAAARDLRRADNPILYMAHWFGNLAVGALSVLARMKSHHFRHENEWRLAHLHTRGHADCRVHSGHGVKTHVDLDLTQLTDSLPLVSIWLAPGVANDESEAVVRKFLNDRGYGHVPIKRSEIPLRGTPQALAF